VGTATEWSSVTGSQGGDGSEIDGIGRGERKKGREKGGGGGLGGGKGKCGERKDTPQGAVREKPRSAAGQPGLSGAI
jgi:hypothetical protein